MELSVSQVKELLQSPNKSAVIGKAVKHEDRMRFHTESFMETSETARPLTTFLDFVKKLIPADKFKIFTNLLQLPISTIKLTNSIYSELERVFEGRNPSLNYQFSDSELRDDWEEYRITVLKSPVFWRKDGWDAMRTAINSILVVDLPEVQEGERPEPYYYLLGIENVIDYALKSDGSFQYLIFKQPKNKIAVFDSESINIFTLNDKGELMPDPVESPHDLGYCPARFFWSTELNQKVPELKKSPISTELAYLDWLLFFSTSKRHLDLYAPYPIYSSYEADCDFEHNDSGDYCDGGYLRDSDNNYKVFKGGTLEQCPVCADSRLAGVGSFIEVPVPTKDSVDMRDPINITSIDRESLDYNVEEVQRMETDIFAGAVGIGAGAETEKKSINEMQVTANFESRVTVLNNLKTNFEAIIKFTDDTCCRLRYGTSFIESSISLGTEFYIYSVKDLYLQYEQAKKNGASEAELDSINDQIIATEYKNDPVASQRMLILKHLEPYRHYTFDELMEMYDKTLLDELSLKVKINFTTFVNRFERENMNIIEFGSKLQFDKKIDIITEKFKDYGKESTNSGGESNR